jgi:predicted nucleic acid-binding protein
MTELLLVDTSAWQRSGQGLVADTWADHLGADEIAICPQVRLEILYSARNAVDYDDILSELDGLHQIPTNDASFERALAVQRTLAHVAGLHHRSVKIADLVIAASAELAGATVWHYDEDFDRIAAVTGQPCQWIAPRGSL